MKTPITPKSDAVLRCHVQRAQNESSILKHKIIWSIFHLNCFFSVSKTVIFPVGTRETSNLEVHFWLFIFLMHVFMLTCVWILEDYKQQASCFVIVTWLLFVCASHSNVNHWLLCCELQIFTPMEKEIFTKFYLFKRL